MHNVTHCSIFAACQSPAICDIVTLPDTQSRDMERPWECWSTAYGMTPGTTRRRARAISSGSRSQFRNWVTADGERRPHRRRRLQGRGRALPSLCLARLPLGAPHADLPQAEEARRAISVSVVDPLMLRERLGVQGDDGATGDHLYGVDRALPDLRQGRSALFRPRHRAGAVGQEDRHDRLQRIRRDHPHVQFAPSTPYRRRLPISIPRTCAPRSMR